MAGEQPEYLAWVRKQPCCAPGCGSRLQVVAHHATNGLLVPPGEPMPPKMAGKRRGQRQKAHDYFAMPLCLKHHVPGVHKRGGPFKEMSKKRLDAWQLEQVTAHRSAWEELQAKEPQSVAEWYDGLPF